MRGARGFTLIEVILATTLFALLMSSYYVVFMRVVNLEEYARDQRAFATVGPAVLDLIEDDLLSLYSHPRQMDAFPLRGEDESAAGKPADRLFFVARRASVHIEEFFGNDNWIASPINEVGYRLGPAPPSFGNVRRLYRREGYYVDSTPMSGGDYYEVYDRVISLEIWYAGYQVEEEERKDQDTLGENRLRKFESWDSEERKGFPTAVFVKLTVQPPRMTRRKRNDNTEEPEQRTFLRIIPLVQAEDIVPAAAGEGNENQGNPAPGNPTPGGSNPGGSR